MKAIRVNTYGGPEVLQLEDVPVPEPKKGEARVRIEFAGVNYIDVYQRNGSYPAPTPFSPGMEGSYAEFAVVPSWSLVTLPNYIDFDKGAAAMLQGMTAQYLARSTYSVKKGDRVLIHAAAGGVGLLLVQVAKLLGAEVFGTVSTNEKASLAKEAGADHVILYTKSDFEKEIKKISIEGVDVVYDSVGKTTFDRSLDCLKPRGFLVSFGQSSGPIPPFDPSILFAKGSLFLARPTLFHYTANRDELLERAGEVFKWITEGELDLRIDKTLPLKDAAAAHELLEGRKTAGKLLLKVRG